MQQLRQQICRLFHQLSQPTKKSHQTRESCPSQNFNYPHIHDISSNPFELISKAEFIFVLRSDGQLFTTFHDKDPGNIDQLMYFIANLSYLSLLIRNFCSCVKLKFSGNIFHISFHGFLFFTRIS